MSDTIDRHLVHAAVFAEGPHKAVVFDWARALGGTIIDVEGDDVGDFDIWVKGRKVDDGDMAQLARMLRGARQ